MTMTTTPRVHDAQDHLVADGQAGRPVRHPTTWTKTRRDGPNHLGL